MMDKAFIQMKSTTFALMAQKDLESIGIYTTLVKTKKEHGGCGYSLKVKKTDLLRAYDYLTEEGYHIMATHIEGEENGRNGVSG